MERSLHGHCLLLLLLPSLWQGAETCEPLLTGLTSTQDRFMNRIREMQYKVVRINSVHTAIQSWTRRGFRPFAVEPLPDGTLRSGASGCCISVPLLSMGILPATEGKRRGGNADDLYIRRRQDWRYCVFSGPTYSITCEADGTRCRKQQQYDTQLAIAF